MTLPDELFVKLPFSNTVELPVNWWGLTVNPQTFEVDLNRILKKKLKLFEECGIKFCLVEPVWLEKFQQAHDRIIPNDSMVLRKGYLLFSSEEEAVQFKLIFADELQ